MRQKLNKIIFETDADVGIGLLQEQKLYLKRFRIGAGARNKPDRTAS